MADNITAPASGGVFATDEIAGVHYPRTKISIGADGSAADVSAANPMPITAPGALAVTGTFYPETQLVSGAVTITAASLPLPADAATAAKQDEATAAIQSLVGANSWFAITPADEDLPVIPDAIYVNDAGDIVARGLDGVDVTFYVQAGQSLPIRPRQIRMGTTAYLVGLIV